MTICQISVVQMLTLTGRRHSPLQVLNEGTSHSLLTTAGVYHCGLQIWIQCQSSVQFLFRLVISNLLLNFFPPLCCFIFISLLATFKKKKKKRRWGEDLLNIELTFSLSSNFKNGNNRIIKWFVLEDTIKNNLVQFAPAMDVDIFHQIRLFIAHPT